MEDDSMMEAAKRKNKGQAWWNVDSKMPRLSLVSLCCIYRRCQLYIFSLAARTLGSVI